MNEDAFADRDAFGLTADDWASFFGLSPEFYTGPALLWWALADGTNDDDGPYAVSETPLPDLLSAIAGDARALGTLASSSLEDDVQALAPALKNLHRRIAAAAEIALRMQELEEDEGRGPRADPAPPGAPPSPDVPGRRRNR